MRRFRAPVLAGLGLLDDDTTPAIRSWIERRAGELPQGFAAAVRAWLLVLLDGRSGAVVARGPSMLRLA